MRRGETSWVGVWRGMAVLVSAWLGEFRLVAVSLGGHVWERCGLMSYVLAVSAWSGLAGLDEVGLGG